MSIRSLFFIILSVVVFYEAAHLLGGKNEMAYTLVGVFAGWGLDYLLTFLAARAKADGTGAGKAKILDSSAIIDGRILDIIDADFVDGDIIIPKFVLDELQMLADSEDGIKRARGRRGLDLIKAIQGNKKSKVIVDDSEYKMREVDGKLLKLAKDLKCDIITTDYNLNKVATIQGIKVLNINKLSNALKPMVIPNEELVIELIKAGDRDGQAVGYLNDGTMVVAEDGGDSVGKTITLVVTSVYPTAAGRMIFGKVKRK